jgi:hypothetical protein
MVERIFYYFLTRAIDDEIIKAPLITDQFLGEVGDPVIKDGVGYVIRDYAEDFYNPYDYVQCYC